MTDASPADDHFHSPTDADPHWSETAWFGFAVPERRIAGTIYPLFRQNLGTCSVAVYVWDDRSHEPWRVPYGRCLWHEPMPDGDLTRLEVAGLRTTCLEPLTRYRVEYEDGDRLHLDLTYEGLSPPHAPLVTPARGHLDQPCRVRGRIVLRGEEIAVDGFEMRDRSWHVRDDRQTTRASYSYGISGDESFLAGGFHDGEQTRIVTGFLVRDGEKADLVGGTRRVLSREGAIPLRVAIEAEDRLGRRLDTIGRCVSRLANQATPGMFAWMSLTDWELGGKRIWGEDQDISSPDLLGDG
jgi:hypothetical protein